MRVFNVYLSSTSYNWWNINGYRWKSELIKCIQHRSKNCRINFIDPLKYKSEDPKVCPLDIRDIDRSNFVVVYLDKITIGTMLELGYCIYNNKDNWCLYSKNANVLKHPWIVYLCENRIYTDIKEVAGLIIKKSKQF